jgi:hypothetical protein
MLTRHPAARTLLFEALRLVQVLGWPVVRGTYLADGACSCLDPRCAAPGMHPASADWALEATGARARIESWWTEHPRAGVVLPTGTRFDVLSLPAAAGRDVLARLERYPEHLGPVATAADGRVLFFVRPGARRSMASVWDRYEAERERGFDWDLRLHGPGDYVVAPPSGLGGAHSMSWLVSPYSRDAGVRSLPSAATVLPHIAASCQNDAAA